MVRVLSLVWYKVLPPLFGGQRGIALFSKHLGRHLDLTCVCSRNNEPAGNETYTLIPALPVSKLQFITPSNFKTIHRLINDIQPSHLLIEHCYYGWMARKLVTKNGLKLIVHSHNIEYLRFRQMGKWWWRILYHLEKSTHRAAHLSLFKTQEDRDHAVSRFGIETGKTMVVPFGIERSAPPGAEEKDRARRFLVEKFGLDPSMRIILFNGTLDYAPNAHALEHIVRDIIPALEKRSCSFCVLVTGRVELPQFRYLLQLTHPRYIYAGIVDNVADYFTGADVFINPVTEGGGVKVKLMEALSFGLPVVSYTAGARGLDLNVAGGCVEMVRDGDAEAMAQGILKSIDEKHSVPPAFYSTYQWSAITEKVAEKIRRT